jgi:hypothetical protein
LKEKATNMVQMKLAVWYNFSNLAEASSFFLFFLLTPADETLNQRTI